MEVLVVDDVAFMRLSLKNMLEKRGHQVICEVCNGKEAIKKYKTFHPDLVTMDINMPIMDGLQTLRAIKKINTNAKVIMVTARCDEEIVTESILAGARGFVAKPVNEDIFIKALSRVK